MSAKMGILVLLVGCGTPRGLEGYRADTQRMLDLRRVDIEACYQKALGAQPTLARTVTVAFVIQPKTGKVTDAHVDTTKTSAPHELGDCVLGSLANLVLTPPDRDEGQATFVYEFKSQGAPT